MKESNIPEKYLLLQHVNSNTEITEMKGNFSWSNL